MDHIVLLHNGSTEHNSNITYIKKVEPSFLDLRIIEDFILQPNVVNLAANFISIVLAIKTINHINFDKVLITDAIYDLGFTERIDWSKNCLFAIDPLCILLHKYDCEKLVNNLPIINEKLWFSKINKSNTRITIKKTMSKKDAWNNVFS